MKIITFVFFVLICLTSKAFSQDVFQKTNESRFLIDTNKPSVYLTFERFGEKQNSEKCGEKCVQKVWLKLHNNSRFPININAEFKLSEIKVFSIELSNGIKVSALPDKSEVKVCYTVESMQVTTSQRVYDSKTEESILTQGIPVATIIPAQSDSYNCKLQMRKFRQAAGVWIPGGNSFIFDAPRSYLTKNLKIYTTYNYEWETENGYLKVNEPIHQVYFYSTDLPL